MWKIEALTSTTATPNQKLIIFPIAETKIVIDIDWMPMWSRSVINKANNGGEFVSVT
jgi:hypothetical protein